MRPPCTVDVAARDAGQGYPHRTTAGSSARRAVHDRCVADTAARSPGRSENVGYSTGFPEASLEATHSGALGWENRFELSMRCPSNEEVGRYALLTDGQRPNPALISFAMRLRFAMTARRRFTLHCTGSGDGRLRRPINGSRACGSVASVAASPLGFRRPRTWSPFRPRTTLITMRHNWFQFIAQRVLR